MRNELQGLDRIIQRQIEQVESRFEGLLELTPDAIVITNRNNQILLINTQAETLLGYSHTELVGQLVESLLSRRFRAAYTAHSNTRSEFEAYAVRKNGSESPVQINIVPFEIEDETLAINYLRDISKRVKALEELAEERRLLNALMNNIPDLIYFKDTASRFTRINRTHAQMLGANDPIDAIGKTDFDFQDHKLAESFREEEKALLESGEPVINREEYNPEPDGTPRWYSSTKMPIMDVGGNITGMVGISHDITERKLFEEALRNSEEQFQTTFSHASIGMALFDLDGRWLNMNKAVCEILGYSEDELFLKRLQDITHPDDLTNDLNDMRQLLADEIQSYTVEKRYFHKQGHEVWVQLSVSLVRGTQEQPLYFISQIQSINEQKQAEQALKQKIEQEHDFQILLKALHEITIELTNIDDLDAFYKRAVELGLQRLGFDRMGFFLFDSMQKVATGTYGTDSNGQLVPEHDLRLTPSDLTGILQRAYESKELLVVDENTPLFSELHPIGSGANAVAVLWNGSEKFGWLAIDNAIHHQPITRSTLDILTLYALSLGTLLNQKRTQAALSEQRNLLRTIIDTLPDQIFLKDRQSRFILVNQATIQSLTASTDEEVLGKSDFDFVTSDIAEALFQEEQALLRSGETQHKEGWIGRPEGHQVYLSTIKTPLRDADGHITGLLGTNRDMTEHWQLQTVLTDKEKLQVALEKETELSQLKTRMMERISHEFRTPLTIIQLTSESFSAYFDRLKPEQRLNKTKQIQTANRQLTDMLDEIGTVIRDNTNGESLHYFNFNLRYLIESVTYELEQQLQIAEKFTLNLPSTMMITGDRDVIKDALFQVLQNAAIYSSAKIPVVLNWQPVEGGFELDISDKGIGILPNELPRIFEPFFRGSNINEIGGLGVGLTIAKRAIVAHKGVIKVESVAQEGTTVKIWLPG